MAGRLVELAFRNTLSKWGSWWSASADHQHTTQFHSRTL